MQKYEKGPPVSSEIVAAVRSAAAAGYCRRRSIQVRFASRGREESHGQISFETHVRSRERGLAGANQHGAHARRARRTRRLENMLVVTKDGAEIMDRFPRDEILAAPR